MDLPGHAFTSLPAGGTLSSQLSLPGMARALAQLMQEPAGAVSTAATWWRLAGCNEIADTGDLLRCRKVLNGGTNGMEDVAARHKLALAVLGGA